jgi:hypothetical protein
VLLFVAFAALAPATEPMLAFSARIYYPPGDKRISHSQLFLSDLHGGHRRQLTHGGSDVGLVRWIAKGQLAWADDKHLYTSALKPFRPKIVSVPMDAEILDNTPRGTVVFRRLERAYQVTSKGVTESDISKWRGVVPIDRGFKDNTATYDMPGGKSLGIAENDKDFTVKYGEQQFKMSSDDNLYLFPAMVRNQTLYMRGQTVAGASHGRNDTIYAIEIPTLKQTKIVGDLANLDYSPESAYYAGLSDGGSGTTPYGPKKVVWSSSVYAGDLKSGKRWLVLGGIVLAGSVSVSPE